MSQRKSDASSARDQILSTIRRGLDAGAVPKPFPEVTDVPIRSVYTPQTKPLDEAFAEAFIALGGKFIYCASEPELFEALHQLTDDREWTETLCADPVLLQKLHRGGLSFVRSSSEGTEGADACITGCEYLVARTGSVVLSSALPGGRIAPVYYPVHIIVARPGQLVEDLGDGLANMLTKSEGGLPSLINLNTGPSRTADIEKTLVVGVHGPKEVFVSSLTAKLSAMELSRDIEHADDVRHLVDTFYVRVRRDDVLAPIFNTIIGEDWSHHLPVLYGFWEMVPLGTGGYTGQVIAKHIGVNQRMPLSEEHFGRWLALWEETLIENFSGPRAEEARKRARLMMDLIRLKIGAWKPGSTLV